VGDRVSCDLGVLGGPCVDDVERGLWWLGWHEAEHVLQQRMDDGMQAAVLECVEVILGLLYIDIAQPGLGAVSQVRDHARGICGPRPSLMRAYISAVIGTW
jgi:hypothetical protein